IRPRRKLGGAERNPTDYQDVGFGKASNATCYNAGNPRNAVAPQPTIFLQHYYRDFFRNQI
ncbi:MAG: hypothetical protein ACYTXY_16575, partial [Nostoc sp.]